MEKIIAGRFQWLLQNNSIKNKFQVTFKKEASTADARTYMDYLAHQSLSSKSHMSVISIDFEKAFDRIRTETILKQLNKFSIGPKIFNLIKGYLTNRRFRVRVNNQYSQLFNLLLGIPQGSPLSVILFQIGFHEISSIINKYTNIDHVIFVDDLYIILKNLQRNKEKTQIEINLLFKDLFKWCEISGGKISLDKSKQIHFCRKTSCKNFNLNINNIHIDSVQTLKILGVVFDSHLTFSHHVNMIKTKLVNRLSLIKCIASSYSNSHINTMTHVTRSLMQGVIDYCLPLYSNCSKTTLNKLKAPYHAGIRKALGALRTTPISNLIAESGLQTIEERADLLTARLVPKLLFNKQSPLQNVVKKILTSKRTQKFPSAVARALNFLKSLEIDLSQIDYQTSTNPKPPWLPRQFHIDLSLTKYKKPDTNLQVFKAHFQSLQEDIPSRFSHIYTDGSKTRDSVALQL